MEHYLNNNSKIGLK